MFDRQHGATFVGMVIIVAIIGFALYGGIRLMPLYMEYMAIVRAMEQTAKENAGATSPQELRTSLDRRWTIEDIKSIDPKEIEIKRTSDGYTMRRVSGRGAVRWRTFLSLPISIRPSTSNRRPIGSCSRGRRCVGKSVKNAAAWLKDALGYECKDAALLEAALTHRSAGGPHNERLEFLGDAVLNCVVAKLVFSEFGAADEGDLSRFRASLVSGEALR